MNPQALARLALGAGAALGLLGVATGAFGAHGLKTRLDPAALATWELASRYALAHAPALLAVGLLAERRAASKALTASALAFLAGAAVFSGTLWLLALTGVKWLGAITPIGGTALIVGWAALAWVALRGAPADPRA